MKKTAASEQTVVSGIQLQMTVVNLGGPYWQQLLSWGNKNLVLAPDEQSFVSVACNIPRKLPSERQQRMEDEGFLAK